MCVFSLSPIKGAVFISVPSIAIVLWKIENHWVSAVDWSGVEDDITPVYQIIGRNSMGVFLFCWFECHFLCALIAFLTAFQWKCLSFQFILPLLFSCDPPLHLSAARISFISCSFWKIWQNVFWRLWRLAPPRTENPVSCVILWYYEINEATNHLPTKR